MQHINYSKTAIANFRPHIENKQMTLKFNAEEACLANVKRIIELHGGGVGVENNPTGVGSVF